jgi:DnaJ-class molecular chaperone
MDGEICPNCYGQKYIKRIVSYTNGTKDDESYKCGRCEGKGVIEKRFAATAQMVRQAEQKKGDGA